MTKEANGSCLCGAVKVQAKAMQQSMGACHCTMCRKWTAGPLLSVECGADVEFEGESNISIYNSSDWAERGFCAKCGTHLFYRLKQNQLYFMSVGVFDSCDDFDFDHQVFIDEKPAYYCFANETKNMTGAELFELYSGS